MTYGYYVTTSPQDFEGFIRWLDPETTKTHTHKEHGRDYYVAIYPKEGTGLAEMDAWVQVKIKIGLLAYGPGVPANVSLSDWTI